MDKVWIIAKSEYLRRVKSRAFILTTLLLPLAIVLFIGVIAMLSVSAFKQEKQRSVAIVDSTGVLGTALVSTSDKDLRFLQSDDSIDSLRTQVSEGDHDGYLVLPRGSVDGEGQITYYSAEGGGSMLERRIERRIEGVVEEERMRRQNLDPAVIQALRANVSLRMMRLTDEGEEVGGTKMFTVLGIGMGSLIVMMMLIYGSVVMQGVIDEKSSRVVEVVISAVKPFHLMLGKVLGIGAMGLTQLVFWSLLLLVISMAAGTVIAMFLDPAQYNVTAGASTAQLLVAADIHIPDFPASLFIWLILYFLGGYLLYASLYAAIGSMVESQQDAQGFVIPVILPIIVAMYTLVPQIENPSSTLSVVMSMVPLTSPISAIVRIAVTDVPLWQSVLSLAILFGSSLGVNWLAGRIYRVGILMYGKKPSLRELIRWIRLP
ncbi:MAG: ABC transporter permease [Gemmatimonadetes bacterium]|nr:ABC transporter permease [Gemmatimonadota bacterium]